MLVYAFVILWAAVGPIGMAFDSCAWMCDTPCGLTTAAISLAPQVPIVMGPVGVAPTVLHSVSTALISTQDPPPRPLSRSL